MYNKHLDSLVRVVDSGSIMKAAKKMGISSSALGKQIGLLEQELDVRLFERSANSVSLTKAGKLIYDEAKDIIKYTNDALRRARELEEKNEHVIRVGTSVINGNALLGDIWENFAQLHPHIHMQIVPVNLDREACLDIMTNTGDKFDVVVTVTANHPFLKSGCTSFELMTVPTCIAAPRNHRLAARDMLCVDDLYGETVIMLKRGIAYDSDEIRDLFEKHPDITIYDVDFYEPSTFNKVVTDKFLLICAENWIHMNPMMKILPVDWDFGIPYGIIYSKNPPQAVRVFVEYLAEVYGKEVPDVNK
ncbi:MAG: LysR family transcriptional regulator [Desulfitobacteriia bacterium]|jgi:DNA-binding transcriptional LysR family regulator